MKRVLALLLSLGMIFTLPMTSISAYAQDNNAAEKDNSKIIIVSTNDAHCQIDKKANDDPQKAYLGYECVAGVKKEEEETYSNVTLVDAGDHIQGMPVGVLTKGEAIIKIMNAAGYGVSTIGNHEFDYGVDRLKELTAMADYPYVSCNFVDLRTGELVYDPYYMESYETSEGTKKVAYVGVTTPESITKSTPKYFQDEDGNFIYGFYGDKTGEALYQQVQSTVDDARSNGADYVILLGHLGQNGVTNIWRSDTIVKNTHGIDAVVDGHSHEEYIEYVQNSEGKDVLISQAGTLLNAAGIMTIDVETGKVEGKIVQAPLPSDEDTAAVVAEIDQELSDILDKDVAQSEVDLEVFEEDNFNWKVRSSETNMADLVTDAYRIVMNADIGISGGGGIRNRISKGSVTAENILSVQPFGNDLAVIKASGQQILDCLEMGARLYPQRCGGFMQVSGLTYKIDTTIASSVVTDANGVFEKVDGRYRVWDVKVNGEPLDLNKVYTVAGTSYELLNDGDGMSMFRGCEPVVSAGPKDFEVLEQYITESLHGVIGTEYEGKDGQGRIQTTSNGVVKLSDGNWYYVIDNVIQTSFTGFAANENGIWYIQSGKVDFSANGVLKGNYNDAVKWGNVKNGKLQETSTIAKNSNGWWYIASDGFVDFSANTIAKNSNGWWRIVNGKVDFTATGVYRNENGWWYCRSGKVQFDYTGIQKNQNGWWRIVNGKVDFMATGVYKNENGWWYCKNGKVDFSYKGLASNVNGTWYIENGKVNFNFTGKAYGRTIVKGKTLK